MKQKLVTRSKTVYNVTNYPDIKTQLLDWAGDSSPIAWYDSNDYPHQNNDFDAILALETFEENPWHTSEKELQTVLGSDWLFGFFSYEYNTAWEQVAPTNPSFLSVPQLQFFKPKKLWLLKGDLLTALYLESDNPAVDFERITNSITRTEASLTAIDLSPRISKDIYLQHASALKQHIMRGDIYEINYCMEWYADEVDVSPMTLFNALNRIGKTPFSAFLSFDNTYLMSASPERFLQRRGDALMSQPIKGTAARHEDAVMDKSVAEALKLDAKERAENIMITDLVRNDLSRIAKKGSVAVSEQCAVYPFAQVHQMISTVEAQCDPAFTSLDVVNACFPMGSMTGAPKQRAMELINQYEHGQRGLYSGAVGYFAPNGDFDFNVVIRSLVYDASSKYLSTHVGSALTAAADPSKEYDECQLKVKAIKRVLANKKTIPNIHGTKV
ncbi:MAG: anthranilate synthase component I family protein [Flavobacteriaceae bacterium]